jgi:hypothetical protein
VQTLQQQLADLCCALNQFDTVTVFNHVFAPRGANAKFLFLTMRVVVTHLLHRVLGGFAGAVFQHGHDQYGDRQRSLRAAVRLPGARLSNKAIFV